MVALAEWIESGTTHSEYLRLDALTHPDAVDALRLWQERPCDGLRIGRDVPSRSIAHLLSNVVVSEPIEGGPDFKVHLAGEGMRNRFGRDITGERLTRLFGVEDFLVRSADLCSVIDSRQPRMARVQYHAGHVEVMKIERLMLPVMAPNGMDCWVLTFIFYF